MAGESRSVVVRLTASVAGYIAGMGKAEAATGGLERSLGRVQKKTLSTDQVMSKVGRGGRDLFLATAGGIAYAEKKAADFNSEMATVQTLAHANARQFDLLSTAAKSVGVNIGYSATDTAKAEEELIKAGVSVKNILGGGLKGALDLAAAGQTDVATATEVAASAMTQFSLRGKDVPHIADLLAAGADKALGSVTDLGYGLSQVGTTAHQMGFSIEATTGTLAQFAQSGLIGEKGGATLKQMLLRLANPTKAARDLMEQLHLSLYDTNGQIKTMPELAGNLQRAFEKLTPAQRNAALGTIFGSRAIQGANILLKGGEKANRDWIKSVDDQGFAARQASGKLNSLSGDLKKLNAELGNALIDGGGKQGFLRVLTQDATKLVKKFNELSDAQKSLIGKGLLGGAAVGGALWTASKIYSLAKGTAALYRGVGSIFSGKGASSALGGLSAAKGTVPVYVTNWGGVGALEKGGAGGLASVGTARGGKIAALGRVVLTAATVELAASVVSPLIKQLTDTGSPGRQKNYIDTPGGGSQFTQPKSSALSFALGSGHTIASDTHTALAAQTPAGKAYAGISQALASIIGQQAGITTSIKNVKDLDSALAGLDYSSPSDGAAAFNDVLNKSGLTTDQLNKILPQTAAAIDKTSGSQATFNKLLLGSAQNGKVAGTSLRNSQSDFDRYAAMLHSLPSGVQTKISAPGFEGTAANIRKLQRQYDLTPRQLKTLVKLLGGQQAIAEANRVQSRLDALNGHTVSTFINEITQKSTVHSKAPTQGGVTQLLGAGHAAGGWTGPGAKYQPAGVVHADEFVFSKEATHGRVGFLNALHQRLRGYATGGAVAAAPYQAGAGVTVYFPAPTVLSKAVSAADAIAAAGVKYAATAQDVRNVHLDDLHLQQQIAQTQKSLDERNKKTVGKGKNRHTVSTGYTLTGLDRKTALAELADYKAQLVEMRRQNAVQAAAAQARADAVAALRQARADEATTLQGAGSVFATSPARLTSNLNREIRDLDAYGSAIAALKAKGASPALLAIVKGQADSGDVAGAAKLGKALLAQPALLGQLNATLGVRDALAGAAATLTTDPRFASAKAWNATAQVTQVAPTSKSYEINLVADPSTWTTQVTAHLKHWMTTELVGG